MRFLCLHGMGTNSAIFAVQLGPILSRLEDAGHEFTFVDGLMECGSTEEIRSVFPGPYLCYYNSPTLELVAAAFEYVHEIIEEEGPFDGVIGFSQGAALAASMLLQSAKQHKKPLFELAIFAGASLPFDIDDESGLDEFYASMRGTKIWDNMFVGDDAIDGPLGYPRHFDPDRKPLLARYHPDKVSKTRISVPTLHIVGKEDAYVGQGRKLIKLCGQQDTVVIDHGEGHRIPRESVFERKVVAAIEKLISGVLLRC
ncbi:hypothetical protein E4T43_07096 [Aureobasidium subglaciale]|nr:hypothetical protein E4T43_07096 [Aureobasidium subglaciale]